MMSETTVRTGIAAVAARAGVAASTVSLYSNYPDRVSPRLAARIQQAMDELHYRANPHARALRTAAAETVYVVLANSDADCYVVGAFRDQADAVVQASRAENAIVIQSEVL